MSRALNNPPSMVLQSLTTIGTVLPPLSSLPSEAAIVESKRNNRNSRWLFELDVDDDDVSFYDLYQSPCRGILRASNDELLDHIDLAQMNDENERNFIINYNNGGGSANQNKDNDLYKAYHYYFDDIEYCGATFFGGCRFRDLVELEDTIVQAEGSQELSSSLSSAPLSYANFTVTYDYEIHYIDNSEAKIPEAAVPDNEKIASRNAVSNDEEEKKRNAVSNDEEEEKTTTSSSTRNAQSESSRRADPIPALEYLERIVAEHMSEVVGLSRRGCDSVGTSAKNSIKRQSYRHGFSDEALGRMLAISSQPIDFLDPDHANCMVPVASTIGKTTDCSPVTGGIRIYLNTTGMLGGDTDAESSSSSLADLELAIQSRFQRLIRFGMQQDMYVSGEDDEDEEEVLVKYVSFIGTRIVSGNADETIVDVSDKEETTTTTNSTGDSDTKDDDPASSTTAPNTANEKVFDRSDDGESPSLNLLDNGIDGIDDSNTGKSTNATALVVASIGLIVLAALVAARSSNTKERPSDGADENVPNNRSQNGAETPVDIERQLATHGASAAGPPAGSVSDALKTLESDQSASSKTEDE